LKVPEIQAEIDKRLKSRKLGADDALNMMSDIARADIDDFFTFPGTFPYLDLEKARRLGKTQLVKRVKVRGDGGVEVELYNSQRAIETMLRHYGLLKDGIDFPYNLMLVVEVFRALEAAGHNVEEFLIKLKARIEQETARDDRLPE